MIEMISIALMLSAAITTAAHAVTCDSFVGQAVTSKSFDQAILAINAPAPKGEFETTAAYQVRIQGAASTGPLIISKRMEDPKYLEYDADRGAFKVFSYLFDNSNYPTWEALYTTPGLDASTISNLDIQISTSDVVTGTYSAQNSYGARATITNITRTLKGVFERPAKSYAESLFPSKDAVVGYLPMSSAQAQAFRQAAKIAFVVVPKSPYVVRRTFQDGETTISNPTKITVNSTILIADIQCGLIINSDDHVVGAYDSL